MLLTGHVTLPVCIATSQLPYSLKLSFHLLVLSFRCCDEPHCVLVLQSDMKAAKADKMRQEKVAAAQREALKATATAER